MVKFACTYSVSHSDSRDWLDNSRQFLLLFPAVTKCVLSCSKTTEGVQMYRHYDIICNSSGWYSIKGMQVLIYIHLQLMFIVDVFYVLSSYYTLEMQ